MALSKAIISLIVVGSLIVVLATIAGIVYATDADENSEIVEVNWSGFVTNEYKETPPQPKYNSADNSVCQQFVNQRYEYANRSVKRAVENKTKLDARYQEILDNQTNYGTELANNADLEAWSVSDWDKSFQYK